MCLLPIAKARGIRHNIFDEDLPEQSVIDEAQPWEEGLTALYETLKEQPEKNQIKADSTELIQAVPEIMRTTAEYLLFKTGRTSLKPKEVKAFIELAENHTPARVQKEIETRVEQFQKNGRKLSNLYAGYIATCLREQNSRTPAPKKDKSGNKKAVNSAPIDSTAQFSISEQVLSCEEAKSIISGYKPTVKNSDSFPTALRELYEKLTPETTLEEYLRLRHPEATEAELDTSRVSDWRGLQQAFEMDCTCASCTDQKECPFNRKKGRPWTTVKYHRLEVGYTLQTRCKHDKGRPDPEFEDRLKRSGLSEFQAKQTFESYDHTGMPAEVISAKAKAILAAKNHSSLVLAGKPGTGKTHLAVAIALEAMREGKQVLFRTVPELIAELRQADWDHTDFFGLRQKFRDVPCLVLDDWGKEKVTEKGMEYLYQIIDYRYRKGLQTVATTNGLKGDVEPLVSRILENGEWVSMKEAENHRLKKRAEASTEPLPKGSVSVPEELCPEASTEPLPISEEPVSVPEELSEVPLLMPEDPIPEEPVPELEAIQDMSETEQNMLPKCDSPAKKKDRFRSIEALLREEKPAKPRVSIYKYFPNYDEMDIYDRKQAALWCLQNFDQIKAEEEAKAEQAKAEQVKAEQVKAEQVKAEQAESQQVKPERNPAYDDEDLWKEDEDEYRLACDYLYRPAAEQ